LPEATAPAVGVDLIYDYKYDTFFVHVCKGYAKNYLYRLNPALDTVLASIETNIAGGGRGAIIPVSKPTYRLIYLSDDIAERWGEIPSDTSLMPTFYDTGFPLTAEAKSYAAYAGEAGKGYAHNSKLPLFRIGDEYVGLMSIHSGSEGLHSQTPVFYTYDPTKCHVVCGWYPNLLAGTTLTYKKWGALTFFHYFTDVFGRRFDAIYRRNWKGIYYPFRCRFPEELLYELGKKRIYTLWLGTAISAGDTTPVIPGFRRKTIHFTSDIAGDLSVLLDAVGRNDWKTVHTEIGTTDALIFTDRAGLRMRFSFSVAATVTLHVMVEQ